ncbi:MAG: DUF3877 family protein [Lachnospiraceae bacterium]
MKPERLYQNIMDQIQEAQLKLGYCKETMRFFFPLSSLNAILQTKENSLQEMEQALLSNKDWNNSPLGQLHLLRHKERLEIVVPPEGVAYVHENTSPSGFLKSFITLFQQNPHCSIEDIQKVFAVFSRDYVCEKMEGADFDYAIYFRNKIPDEYIYCIKMEMGHTIYHRFIPEDYEQIR